MRMLLAMSGMAMALAGCSTVSDVIGTGKDAPDEFAIVTKQPLVIPPDFNLHPPRPGAAPTNQLSPTDSAQAALFSDDPGQVASTIHGDYSDGEKMLLARAGAADATDSIRQLIAADNKRFEAADSDFTSSLLFGGGSGDEGHPLNADAEKARLDSMGVGSRPVADAAPAPMQTYAPAQGYAPAEAAAPPQAYATAPAPSQSAVPAVGGALPPIGAAPQASAPAPAQTASTYSAPPQPAIAGTLPPVGSDQNAQPARSQPRKAQHKDDDSGWLDGIF
ncbi:MAG TPA: DUF3035 domain-containing protein [Rhizomicrobium sp.]|nr:DUF3035 domain-containing protein [Rhizomicrobium sp.]